MLDLHGIIRLVLDKSWLIVSCVVLAVIFAAIYVQRAPRIYEATTTVQVEQEEQKVIKVEQVVSEDLRGLEILNTIAQKLRNLGLLEEVLEANNMLPPVGASVTNASGILTREEIISRFEKSVKTSLRRNTRLIDISVRNADRRIAARLANSLVESYLGQDTRQQQTTTAGAGKFLLEEAARLKKKLETSEQALQDYRREVGSVSLAQNQDIISPALQDLNKRLTQSTADVIQSQGAYQDSLKMGTNIADLLAYPQIAADPDVSTIAAAIARLENDFAVIRQRYREKHPKYILAASSLDGLKEQLAATVLKVKDRIQQTLHITYETAFTAQQGLKKELQDTESKVMQLSDKGVRFNVLSREVASDRVLFDSVINRLNETSLTAQIAPERIRVIQPALVPEKPASPKIKLIFALALFGGLALGLGISFVLYSIDTSFRTVEEVEHHLGLPVLGSVPKLPQPKTGEGRGKLVATEDSNSMGAEVFRTLRTTLSMLGREQDRRIYLFTSSLASEGKTFTSVNYAVSLAQQGLRTLLIDIDLRRPMIEEFFLGKDSHLPGITDYFLGHKKLNELWRPHKDVPNLSWLPAGSTVPNPSELLTQADFKKLLADVLSQFDRVVIDTAPVLPVSDTLLLVEKVQTVVLVVQGCKTPRKAVARSLQLLKNANAPIGGVVLNLLPHRRHSGYYYSYYHGYGYGHYGRKDSKEKPAEVAS